MDIMTTDKQISTQAFVRSPQKSPGSPGAGWRGAMKRMLSTVLVLFAVLSAFALDASAANPDTMTLTVTIGNALSVRIKDSGGSDLTNYDFGSMSLGQASVNATQINIDNDSGGLTETLQLSVGDNGANSLLLRTTAGVLAQDEYRLQAVLQDAQPTHANFGSEDTLTTSAQAAQDSAGGRFAVTGVTAAEDGVSVTDDNRLAAASSEVRLWLRLELAASSTLSGVQTNFATVFVSAV
jgi:spore coat protein U-like protein